MVVSQDAGPTRQQVEVTCASCGKQTTVPFVPTPGRPVFCRDCFSKQRGGAPGPGPSGPRGGGGGGPRPSFGGPRPSFGGDRGGGFRTGPRPAGNDRKRMMAQGRKTHFMYDARQLLRRNEGGMDEAHHRAFLEGLFARGARTSTAAAKEFLDEKLADGSLLPEEHRGLVDLVERYSFWR